MKQELIDSFMLKNSGKFTAEQQMNLHKLLKSTSDEAFTILMTHQAPANPIVKGVLYLLGVFFTFLFILGFYFTFLEGGGGFNEEEAFSLIFVVPAIAAFIGAKCLKPSRSTLYEAYYKIALSYQIKD
jgi:hypothetical protein